MPRGTINTKSAKGASGAGTIRKKTVKRNGKEYTYWEARFTTGFDPGTGKQIQKSVSGKTQADVARKLREATVEVDRGLYIEPAKMTVAEWLDIWTEEYLSNVKPRTVQKYKYDVQMHIKPALGAVKLGQLTPLMVQHFYNEEAKGRDGRKGLSPKSIKDLHGILHKALQQAVDINYLRDNPTSHCKIPRVEKPEIQPLDAYQITDFLRAIKGDRFEALYTVALFTGMRRAELSGLKWDCVDFWKGTICVKRQWQKDPNKRGGFVLSSTKNGKPRIIKPAASVMEILRKERVKQAELRLKAGPAWLDEGFVFCNELGHPASPNTAYNNFKKIVERMGLPKTRMHDLRHTFAVASIANGDDIKTVQENLGHASAAFTLDRYGHVTDSMRQASSERMERFFLSVSCQ